MKFNSDQQIVRVEGHFTGQRHLGENLDQHLVAGKGKIYLFFG
jgi:hypothetical protein